MPSVLHVVGAGKTHTMEGSQQDPGINYRAMEELFRYACNETDTVGRVYPSGPCCMQLQTFPVCIQHVLNLSGLKVQSQSWLAVKWQQQHSLLHLSSVLLWDDRSVLWHNELRSP